MRVHASPAVPSALAMDLNDFEVIFDKIINSPALAEINKIFYNHYKELYIKWLKSTHVKSELPGLPPKKK